MEDFFNNEKDKISAETLTLLSCSSIIKDINNFNPNILKIYICYPKIKSQETDIHFIIDVVTGFSFFCLAELSTHIQNKIKCEFVNVQPRNLFSQRSFDMLFGELIHYSSENIENIQLLIKHNYMFY
jgi:hypothetical protein